MTRLDRSLVDAAGWAAHARTACGLLAAAVQQRLTRPDRLVTELERNATLPRRRLLRLGRGNAMAIAGEPVLHFPTSAVRLEEETVLDQLRRMYERPW